jgi:hypothetical protein
MGRPESPSKFRESPIDAFGAGRRHIRADSPKAKAGALEDPRKGDAAGDIEPEDRIGVPRAQIES